MANRIAQSDPGQVERMIPTPRHASRSSRSVDLIFGHLLAPVPLANRQLLDAGNVADLVAAATDRGAVVYSISGPDQPTDVGGGRKSRSMLCKMNALPLRSEAFDVVLCTRGIEHTPDPLGCLEELARSVRVSGHLVLTTPSRLWQPVARSATKLRRRSNDGLVNYIWPSKAKRVLERQGLHVEELVGFNLLPLFERRFECFHRLADRLGHMLPAAYANFGLRARRMWSFGVDPGVPEEAD